MGRFTGKSTCTDFLPSGMTNVLRTVFPGYTAPATLNTPSGPVVIWFAPGGYMPRKVAVVRMTTAPATGTPDLSSRRPLTVYNVLNREVTSVPEKTVSP